MEEYQAIKGREVLNPPRVAEYADTSAKPTYLKSTHALDVRKMRTLSPERVSRIHQLASKQLTWHMLTPDEVAAKMEEAEERRRHLSLKMPRAQFEKEQKIIQAMHHKLTFLRNPRHPLPPAVKLLMEQRPEGQRWAGPRAQGKVGARPPIKANMTAEEDVIFVVEPELVEFTDYAVGRTYEKLVRVRNVTAVSRGLRVFPPASQYFHVSLPRFPGEAGLLAPGMAAELTLRFCPDSLGDYEDAIAVDATGRRLTVPLRARRPPPSLTLPEEIDMGQVVIGNVRNEQVSFRNLGGPGRFRIVPEADWPDFAQDAPTDRAVVGPFKIWPLCFEMASNEEIALNIEYEPTDWGNSEERLVLVCDNCQVKTFTVLGNGVSVDVLLHSVDGRMLEPRELDLPLWFGEVAPLPGAGFAKTVSVRNTTRLPFAFEWGLTRYPQVQHSRRPNEPLQTEAQYDEEQDDEGHVLLVDNRSVRGSPPRSRVGTGAGGTLSTGASGGATAVASNVGPGRQTRPAALAEADGTPWGVVSGSGPHGPDPLALGAVSERVFTVVPDRGVLQPGEIMEFLITFTPPACQRYERWAQLRVDRTPANSAGTAASSPVATQRGGAGGTASAPPTARCDVLVAEVGLEGLGCCVELGVQPRLLAVPGTLMSHQRVTRRVELRNPTRGQLEVRLEANNPAVVVSPSVLTLPPLGSGHCDVAITAPAAPGRMRALVHAHLQPGLGPPVAVEVRATVGASRVSLVTQRVDFGLVRLGGTGERPIVIRNCSSTCATPWSIRELTPALAEEEKKQLLRKQLLKSSRMLDPTAAAAALEALRVEDLEAAGDEDAPLASARSAASVASAASRRAAFTVGKVPLPQMPSHHGSEDGGHGAAASGSTHVTFAPSSGVLGPGEEATVHVRCHALTDGRCRSIVQLRSGTAGGATHMECIEAFVCVVTPKCVIDRPVIDLGVTFVGVQVRQNLKMKNLSLLPLEYRWGSETADEGVLADVRVKPERGQLAPGEEVELQVRYTPKATGRSVVYGVCELDGAPKPLGFKITSTIAGLDVTYDLLTHEEYNEMVAAEAAAIAAAAAPPPPPPALPTPTMSTSGADVGDDISARRAAAAAASAAVSTNLLKRGRHGKLEVDVNAFQGLTHLPPEILSRLVSGRGASSQSTRPGASSPARRSARGGSPSRGGNALAWPPPSAQRHLVADFGTDVPLGETRQMYVVITNRTAMHTSVRTWLDRFGVEDASRFTKKAGSAAAGNGGGAGGRKASVASMLESDGAREAPAVGPKIRTSKYTPIKLSSDAEKNTPFRAARGNEMMATRRLQHEAEQVLGSKGLAVSVTPPETTLGPWSRRVLSVSCFNDMCGAYMDMMHVKVGDLASRDIPVLVGVAGSPLVVQRERVLVRGLGGRTWRTALEWGAVPRGTEQQRTFYVFNTGSLAMHLSWQLLRFRDYQDLELLPPTTDVGRGGLGLGSANSLYDGPGRLRDTRASIKLFDLKLTPDEKAGCVRVKASRHADPDDGPFVVEPREQIIKGGDSAKFSVTFTAPEAVSRGSPPADRPLPTAAYLHGACRVHGPEPSTASPTRPSTEGTASAAEPKVQLRLWPKGPNGEQVGAMLSGTFHPHAGAPAAPLEPLRVELSAASLPCRLEPDGLEELKWRVTSIHQPASHPSFVHCVTLSNTQGCAQVFSLGVEGPWDLLSASTSVPQDPVAYRGTSRMLGQAESTGRLGGSPADGGTLFLPPRESVDVTLRFMPGKGDWEALPVRFAQMQAKQRIVETTTDYTSSGALTVAFANGDTQRLQLRAEMLHPKLLVNPRKLNFGRVHLQSPKELFVTLSNPTNVDAAWAVTVEGHKPRFPTLPGAGAAASAQAEAAAAAAAASGTAAAANASSSAAPTPRSGRSSNTGGPAEGREGPSATASRCSSSMSSRVAGSSSTAAAAAAVTATSTAASTAGAAAPASGTQTPVRAGTADRTNGVPPPPKQPAVTAGALPGVTGIIAEARIGPYIVRPASGVLPGRGLLMPHTQKISITFAPTEAESYDGELIFAVLRGKECTVDIDGIGSIEETDEHKGRLFVI
ncbi:hypothetical protein GPECTOR_51g734 [Gonium pectorale]|uniref:Deleted in lung and esophageal cancer protein 1 Ig-like domain-containing protein n=1 Tax=Gonium pectorale TaxID=33097 RepID=A0A150G7E2_GONPE|nr:hypothetical protein GPECTOR_51g734 [Gonium pectorale]|eukprot:KXZ45748.1 hypothetical protein GPECTOR_51g734 [Gonium pectorale]